MSDPVFYKLERYGKAHTSRPQPDDGNAWCGRPLPPDENQTPTTLSICKKCRAKSWEHEILTAWEQLNVHDFTEWVSRQGEDRVSEADIGGELLEAVHDWFREFGESISTGDDGAA